MWGRLLAVKALHTASYSPRLRTAKGRREGGSDLEVKTNTTKPFKKKKKKSRKLMIIRH